MHWAKILAWQVTILGKFHTCCVLAGDARLTNSFVAHCCEAPAGWFVAHESAGMCTWISESSDGHCLVRAEAGLGERLKILVVDDHKEFRKYVCSLLESQPRFAVVGEAANGVEAVGRASELQPDVVVLDINMPVLGGIEAAQQILLLAPKTQIIFLSQDNSEMMIQGAMAKGARAYVVKTSATTDLVKAVDSVVTGKKFVSPRRRRERR